MTAAAAEALRGGRYLGVLLRRGLRTQRLASELLERHGRLRLVESWDHPAFLVVVKVEGVEGGGKRKK